MENRRALLAGIGDWYGNNSTGYTSLPFIYKNIQDLQDFLTGESWEFNHALVDPAATKDNIINGMKEQIDNCNDSDWLLFYFTGHGAHFDPGTGIDNIKVYCVTYAPELKFNNIPAIEVFLTEDDYKDIVLYFAQKVKNGHLITILDCCFAFGLIDSFSESQDFHTVIAASSKNTSAFYSNNSAFFMAFSKCWGSPIGQLQTLINEQLAQMAAPNSCIVKPAPKFQDKTL